MNKRQKQGKVFLACSVNFPYTWTLAEQNFLFIAIHVCWI